MIEFFDTTDPASLPDSTERVAAYVDGRYAWPADQLARFRRHIKITVTGDPAAAEHARCVDCEQGDATAAGAWAFVEARHAFGFHDATIYASLSNVPSIIEAMPPHAALLPWRLWIAWWWDLHRPPIRIEVHNQLIDNFAGTHLALPAPRRIWACQWRSATAWDESVCYGPDDFTGGEA